MVEIPETFTPADVPEDDRSFEPVPAGTYKIQVIESKIDDTKSGTGKMLVLTLEIVEGEYANRRIWDRLNIQNDNPDAQRIAQRALADLCIAVGVNQLRNTDDLHFKPFLARITVQPDKTGQYGPQNRVRYTAAKQRPATAAQGQPQRGTPPKGQAAAGNARPWNSPAAKAAPKDMDDEIPF